MWLSNRLFDLLNSNRDEVIKLRTERDSLKEELVRSQILSDWLRLQVNTLQIERAGLLEKAHGIRVPAPLIEKAPVKYFSFDDVGDEVAKKLGLPTYN
jgi:hypothetical protein